jgi:hypothetical protein
MFRFKLTYSGTDTTVIEPKGWSNFKSEIKRDFNTHGVIFKYTSGTLKLGFADGRDVLETAFQNDGYDAVVTLTVDQRASTLDAWTNTFTGNAVMKNRELDEDYFNVDFETSTFIQKAINRLDTKVKLDATIDLDGGSLIGTISSQSDTWQDIRLKNSYRADFREGAVSSQSTTYSKSHNTTDGTPVYSWLVFNYEGELEDKFGDVQVVTELFSTGQIANDSGDQNFIINSESGGDVTVTGSLKYRFHGTLTTDATQPFMDINLRFYVRKESTGGTLVTQTECFKKTIAIDTTASPVAYDSGVLTEALTSTTMTLMQAGFRLFLYAEVEADVGDGGSVVTTNATNVIIYDSSTVKYSLLKAAGINTVTHYHVHDVIERILYIITGKQNPLYSDFFGVAGLEYASDGCGGLTSITNGSLLRGLSSPPEISLSDVLESLHAIYGIGWGFEKVAGAYRIRIELMEYFYGDTEILDLGSPVSIKEGGSYKESTFNKLAFNTVEIGYSKFTSDENYTGDIDDFLTKAEYTLPVSSIKGSYRQISPLITSGRLIQATYESKSDLTKAWKHDDDNFIVSMARSGGDFIPELDENFQTVGGFSNSASDTAYNLRFAPVYMFLNHALIVNSVLMGKAMSKIITNTSVKINKSFSALFNSSESCLLGDEQRLTRTSVGNITIGNNYIGNRLFDPIQHEFTVAMTKTQLDLIIDNMENNGSDNYGYLSYKDNAGTAQQGYLLSVIWNPNDEIAQVKTLEKADHYGV